MNQHQAMPNTGNTGYVNILTNPSFKEDWVKIGKSSRPVNVRSKKKCCNLIPFLLFVGIKKDVSWF